jgi:predicted metal-binding membrane protein
MGSARLLIALRLARPAGRRGFCPACGLGGAPLGAQKIEGAGGAVLVAAALGVAAVAWAVTVRQMLGATMTMGLGSLGSFATTWTVMMAAMMLPSAIPLVHGFARRAEGRRGRSPAVAMLVLVYLAVWLAFGVVCYLAYDALGMPWRHQALAGAGALGLAALYALTPLKRISQDRCRKVCALHGVLPFNLVRAGALAGWRYGLSCVSCSGGLMVAMVLIGTSSLAWMAVLAALVIVYKFAPPLGWRLDAALAVVVAAMGVAYAALG